MSTQQTIDADAQTTLGYWSRFNATVLTACPLCHQPVAKRGLNAHISSSECEPAQSARDNSEFREVRAR